MRQNYDNFVIALILIVPGLYLVWYATAHPAFFEQRRWEKWRVGPSVLGYAFLAGAVLRFIFRCGGLSAVRWSLQIFGIACLGVGIWAAFSA